MRELGGLDGRRRRRRETRLRLRLLRLRWRWRLGRDTWRDVIGGGVEEDGGGLVRDGEVFALGEGEERGAGEAEGPDVIGVRRRQVVASVDGLFH